MNPIPESEEIPLPRKRAPKSGQILPLTSVRYFLAFWVVTLHQLLPGSTLSLDIHKAPVPLENILRSGYVAVSAFFALSGFVLAYNYKLESRWTRRELEGFAIARLARIYPIYLLGLVLLSPFIAISVYRWPASLHHQAVGLAANLTLVQSWMPSLATTWNYPGWSLSDEAFFYLCFPFLGVLIWRTVRSWRHAAAWAVVLFAIEMTVPALAALRPIHGFGDIAGTVEPTNLYWASAVKFNPVLHLCDFLLGVLTARVYRRAREGESRFLGRGSWLYGPGLALWLLGLACSSRIPYPLMHNGLLTPLFACVILGFALGGGWLASVLSWRPLVLLGQASYALYILQVPVFWFMTLAYRHWVGSGDMIGGRLFVLYAVIATAASVGAFLWIEEPCNRMLRRRLSWRKDRELQATTLKARAAAG